MNAKACQVRKGAPEYVIGWALFLLDLMVRLIVGSIMGIGLLYRQFARWIRDDRKNLWALIGGPAIAYFAWGAFRCLGVFLGEEGMITYWPFVDWWWAYPAKFVHWVFSS